MLGAAAVPDLAHADGRVMFLELKRPGGRLTEDQQRIADRVFAPNTDIPLKPFLHRQDPNRTCDRLNVLRRIAYARPERVGSITCNKTARVLYDCWEKK
jgi:hypothetical protein